MNTTAITPNPTGTTVAAAEPLDRALAGWAAVS
jgi:hypothetical protein